MRPLSMLLFAAVCWLLGAAYVLTNRQLVEWAATQYQQEGLK